MVETRYYNESRCFYVTGRRKTSVARCWVLPGGGKITINNRLAEDYFSRKTDMMFLRQPLLLTETERVVDVMITVVGGGTSGQAGAIRQAIARGLLEFNPEFRSVLKHAGFLTRDSRKKERKKYGQRGARARFQYSKR